MDSASPLDGIDDAYTQGYLHSLRFNAGGNKERLAEIERLTPEQLREAARRGREAQQREAEENRAYWTDFAALPLAERLRLNWSGWLFGTNQGVGTIVAAFVIAVIVLILNT